MFHEMHKRVFKTAFHTNNRANTNCTGLMKTIILSSNTNDFLTLLFIKTVTHQDIKRHQDSVITWYLSMLMAVSRNASCLPASQSVRTRSACKLSDRTINTVGITLNLHTEINSRQLIQNITKETVQLEKCKTIFNSIDSKLLYRNNIITKM